MEHVIMSVAFLLGIAAIPTIFILRGPIGRGLADRIARRGGAADGERVERLDREVQELRAELSEVHERLDFTERMLAQQREAGRLSAPGTSPRAGGM